MNLFKKIAKRVGVNQMVDKSKVVSLPGFHKVSLFDMFRGFKKQIAQHNLIERASAISYNFFMALPPTMIFIFTLLPIVYNMLPVNIEYKKQIVDFITGVVPAKDYNQPIIEFVNSILDAPRADLLSVGILLSLFFSSNAVMGLMRSFDKDLPGFIKRKGLQKRGNALKVTLVLDFLFILCLAALAAQENVLDWLGLEQAWLKSLINYTRWIFILALFLNIVSYIYRAVPSVNKKWPWLTPGSVFATVFMVILALGFSLWVNNFGKFNKLYASIGAVLLVLIYIFVNSLILLIGFEINVSIRSNAQRREEHKEDSFAEDVLI